VSVRAVVVVGVALSLAGSVRAAFPGANGELAYFYAGEVSVVSADGARTRMLGSGLSPAWAPNGRRLAFDAQTGRNFDIWTMRADGRDRRRVTTDPAPDYFASWSPDGTQIVFTSDRGGEDLFVIGADGAGERRLTTDPAPDWGPAWSPDGTRIAFAGNARGNLEVELVDVTGAERVALTDHPARDYDPAWSPDGTRIAFTSERDGDANVYVMNADGSGLTQLTSDPSGDWRPAWSPDGTRIAFESSRDPAAFDRDVFVMNADGTDQRRIRSGNVNARDLDWQPTVDLVAGLRLRGRRAVVTIRNATPVATDRVVLTVRAPRPRKVTIGALGPLAVRSVSVPIARRVRAVTVSVSGWHADPRPRNNRVVARR
jgi:TolB protein